MGSASGIDFVHDNGARGNYYYVETFGSGATWVDYDGDGWLDLYLLNGAELAGQDEARRPPGPGPVARRAEPSRLYRNLGGAGGGPVRFADATAATGATHGGYGMGACAADVEGDGDVDLFVTSFGPDALLLQEGGRFADGAVAAGVADPRWSTAGGFLDADLDGDLDLAVVHYVDFRVEDNPECRRGSIRTYCDPDRYAPVADAFFRNDTAGGGAAFADVTSRAGFTGVGRGLGLALADADLDGDTDLYVANDGQRNFLYRNDSAAGDLRLVEVGLEAGVGFNAEGRAEAGMGTDFGDVNGDGWPDLAVANFSRETNTLYLHTGEGGLGFADATRPWGLAEVSFLPLGFGLAFFDADSDGDLDLAVANGHVLDRIGDIDPALTYRQPDQLLLNDGGRQFVDASPQLGAAFADPRVSRAAAPADYDNDGDVDLLVTSGGDRPRLLRNDGPGGHWLLLSLVATAAGNRGGLGARAEVAVGGRVLMRQACAAGSYLSGRDPRLHVGLGDAATARVTVHWPGGGSDTWDLAAGPHVLRQGASPRPH